VGATANKPYSAKRRRGSLAESEVASTPACNGLPSRCTYLGLRQLTNCVAHDYDAELGKAGLKTTQYALLSEILKLQPLRPGELARAMRLDHSTLSRNLKPLLAAGWVDLAPGSDGRSRSISLTNSGRAKQAEGQRHWRVAQRGMNEALGTDCVVALHTLIDACLATVALQHRGHESVGSSSRFGPHCRAADPKIGMDPRGMNEVQGTDCVVTLHALIDECLATLAPQHRGHESVGGSREPGPHLRAADPEIGFDP